ncbi:MAG: AAA family ATPase [bacterium]
MIKELHVENYKSLKNVTIEPGRLNIFLGANASGKSNFIDCLDFIAKIHRFDLKPAIADKMGYHNICFRRHRRSKGDILVNLVCEYDKPTPGVIKLGINDEFRIGVGSEKIKAGFEVKSEKIGIKSRPVERRRTTEEITLERTNSKIKFNMSESLKRLAEASAHQLETLYNSMKPGEDELIAPKTLWSLAPAHVSFLSGLQVLHLSPIHCKWPTAPMPNARLGFFGDFLPSTVDFLLENDATKRTVEKAVEKLEIAVPTIKTVKTHYTDEKKLSLTFVEKNDVPWKSYEVSDGTIMLFALLVALFDDRSKAVAIDEPENSVHPWIARTFIDICREASGEKQIFITTHSPVLADAARYDELFLVERENGETSIAKAADKFPEFEKTESFGELWLSGAIGAVPPSQIEFQFTD